MAAAQAGAAPVTRLALVDAIYDRTVAELSTCSADEAFDLVVALLGRQAARLQALTIRALVRLAELRPAPPADLDEDDEPEPYSPFLHDELAPELRQSPRTVANKLSRAWEVAHRLPDALDAMASGELDQARLLALFDVTRSLSDGQRAVVEAQMLAGSQLGSPSLWRRKARRLVQRVDPEGAARRHREARGLRNVTIAPLEDGMGMLSATLSAQDARAIYDRIDQVARTDARTDGDDRPLDARRADVLAALLLGNRRELVKVEIQVIASIGTLAGLDDNPAELAGYGPIPAAVGRALAADAAWRRVLTDPDTGTVVDLGHRRVPTPALARLVRHRDVRCLFPGCGVPATRCDLDHTRPHVHGGHTALDNLGLLCSRHHGCKHNGGWTLDQPQPGVFAWTSPAGRIYRVDSNSNEEEGLLPEEDHRTWKTSGCSDSTTLKTLLRLNPEGHGSRSLKPLRQQGQSRSICDLVDKTSVKQPAHV